MIMFDELNKYKNNNHFFFSADQSLASVCNTPKNICGVYVVFALTRGKVVLVYIGSSGKMQKDGKIRIRKGGLYDRIVNGKQFDGPRRISWPDKMKAENIEALDIYWYDTFNNKTLDIPAYIEAKLLQKHFEVTGFLPEWNEEF